MNKNLHFYTEIDLQPHIAAEGGKLPKEIEVMRVGTYKHPLYGDFTLTHADLDKFVDSWSRGVRAHGENGEDKDLPINERHDREGKARGWMKSLRHDGDGVLRAATDWTELGKEEISKKLYRYISPEWYLEYEDPESAQLYTHVLVGAGLTNVPYFKKLNPLTMSESSVIILGEEQNTMDKKLQDILAKDKATLSDEEKTYVREHRSDLSTEQQESFKDVLETNPEAARTEENPSDNKEGDKNTDTNTDTNTDKTSVDQNRTEANPDENKGGDNQPNEASEGNVMISASELQALRLSAKKADEVYSENKKMKLEKEFNEVFMASEKNANGKLAPAQRDAFVGLMMSMSEGQQKQLREFVNTLPKLQIFGENGASSAVEADTAEAKVLKMADELIKNDANLSKTDAIKRVLETNKELAKEYNASFAK
jgi:hypothetical protein